MGRYEEAIKEQEKSEVLSGSTPEEAATRATVMERAFKNGGEKGFWQKHLELALEASKQPGALSFGQRISRGLRFGRPKG